MTLAPVVTISRSVVAARSLRYPETEKSNSDQPRVLYRDGINCRPETAIEEFARLRHTHGHDGAKALRKVPATYDLPEPGEQATHLRKVYPSGRKHWAEPRDGETATHVRHEGVAYEPAGRAAATHRRVGRRWVEDPANATHVAVEGGYVRGTEAINLIYSFDLSSVNPHDAADTERAFHYVRAELEEKFSATDGSCAVQAKLVAQADAKGMVDEHGNTLTEGGKFHVHAVLNAVQVKDMEIDGEIFKAGRKLSAKATDIEWLKDRHDQFAREHQEWGFTPQPKNREERQADKRSTMDRRMAASGRTSNHDTIRDSYEACMNDPRVSDLNSFIEVMHEDHGITVNARGKKKPTLSYRLEDMPQSVRGHRLGDHYTYERTLSQLEANAAGLPRRKQRPQRKQLPPKPDPIPTIEEIEEARRVVTKLAYEEALERWIEDWAEEEGLSVERLSIQKDFNSSNSADRQLLHRWKAKWESEQRPLRDKTAPSTPTEPTEAPSTSTEKTLDAQAQRSAETAAQRLLRRFREDEEHEEAQDTPNKRARRPLPTLGKSFAELNREAQERADRVATQLSDASEAVEQQQDEAAVSKESLDPVRGSTAPEHTHQDDQREASQETKNQGAVNRDAWKRAMKRLEQRGDGLTIEEQAQGPDQLE